MRTVTVAVAVLGALMLGAGLSAQSAVKPSQLGSVTQEVNQTKITIDYSRPVARGRTLFGQLVPWGRIWTPGANDATTLTTTTDIEVNGQKLAKGTYTVWSVPQAEQWTIIFNSAHPVFHLRHDEVASKDILKVETKPREAQHMETLAWYFPVVDGRKAELVVHWGTTVVPLQIQAP